MVNTKLLSFIFVGFLFLWGNTLVRTAHAGTTGELYMQSYVGTPSNVTNSANMLGAPDSQYATNNGTTFSAWRTRQASPSATVDYTTVSKVTFKLYRAPTPNTGTITNSSIGIVGGSSCTIGSIPSGNGIFSFELNSGNCAGISTIFSDTNINAGVISFNPTGQTIVLQIDAVSIEIEHDGASTDGNVTVSLDNLVASPAADLVYLDFSGDIGTAGADIKCDIAVYERASRTNYAGWTNKIATIKLDTNSSRTSTEGTSGSTYYGYFSPLNSSTWLAKGIKAPYNPEYDMEYPWTVVCYKDNWTYDADTGKWTRGDTTTLFSKQGLSADLPNFEPSYIATASGGTTSENNSLCSSIDLICRAFNGFKDFITLWIVPDTDLNTYSITTLKSALSERAPFAYAYAVFAVNWSAPVSESSTPTLVYNVTPRTDAGIDQTFNFIPPAWIDTTFTTTKSFLVVVLWGSFVVYIFLLSRRLTQE